MRRDEINWLVENSFVEHKSYQRRLRVHLKGAGDKFTEYKDFHYTWVGDIWKILESELYGYEAVILEWLVNVWEKDKPYRDWTTSTGAK